MSFCSHCGTRLEPESHFCPSCGESVELDSVKHNPGKEAAENREFGEDHPAPSAPPELPETDRPLGSPTGVAPTGAAPVGVPTPTKKKLSGCALAAIIGGGAFVFFMAIIAIVMGVTFSTTSEVSDQMDEWLVKVRSGDVEGPYGMTSSGFREITPLEGFRQYLNSYPVIKNSVKAKYSDKTIEDGVTTLLGTLVDATGVETKFAAQLVKEGEEWKVQSIQLPDAVTESGTSIENPATSPAAMALEDHLSLLKQGNLAAAYKMTTPEFKAATTMEAYGQYVATYPMIADVNSVEYEKGEESQSSAMMNGFISDSKGQKHRFQAHLNLVNETWLLHVFNLPDSPHASGSEPQVQDFVFKSVSHPEYHLKYSMPNDWIEETDGSRFVVKPTKGAPYEKRVWMAVLAFPNQAARSTEELGSAIAESLKGLADVKIDGTNLVLTTIAGEPLTHENELPAGQYGNFMSVLDYHFMYESTPWKGMVIGAMRHDDKGKFHYIISIRSEENCWDDLGPVITRFLGMENSYGTL